MFNVGLSAFKVQAYKNLFVIGLEEAAAQDVLKIIFWQLILNKPMMEVTRDKGLLTLRESMTWIGK